MTKTYRDACIAVAEKEDVAILDTWDAFKGIEPKEVLVDGLHLNKRGNTLVFEALLELIRSNFPALRKENLNDIALDWKLLV